ncbi:MAG TPA: phenylalanine--tRNA ligase subunit beta [candidate division Zixibacteria bacterium]|nr:phenylalanine--tRNA ligase subunit beta [candidate division Zixibacteria bacterium]
MKFPLKWLLELCPFDDDPNVIAKLLTESGSEVEDIQDFSDRLSGVVVGQVVEMTENSPLPGMFDCKVEFGEGRFARVLSRAPNVRVGSKYPFAPTGARIFGGKVIGVADFDGEKSEGMLCSGIEIGLGEPKDKLLELRPDEPLGADVLSLLGWDDHVFELEITPNRPDCYGVLSLAREISALTGAPLLDKRLMPSQTGDEAAKFIKIALDDPSGCPRYVARIIEAVRVGPSPLSTMGRLSASGIRPINNIVDATNYVLLFMSHPLHAFDLDKLESDTIVVRSARDGEEFVTLDGERRKLKPANLMITTPDKALAIAGVMGGLDCEVTESTKRILIESAYFNPRRIRASSRRLGLVTESSIRFERGADPNGASRAADECTAIIDATCDCEVRRGIVDAYPEPIEPLAVKLSPRKVEAVLGIPISEEEYAPRLTALGFERTPRAWVVPTYRPDITREIDLVEEVGRLYGYAQIQPVMSGMGPIPARNTPDNKVSRKIGEVLRGRGFFEIMSDSMGKEADFACFFDGDAVRLENPISQDFAIMRPMIIPGLLRIAGYNLNRESDAVRLYEIDKVFALESGEPSERKMIGIVMAGAISPEDWSGVQEPANIFDFKGVVEQIFEHFGVHFSMEAQDERGWAPGKCLRILMGEHVGVIGMVAPKIAKRWDIDIPVFAGEIPLAPFVEKLGEIRQFAGVPRFPSTRRDVALVVDANVKSGEVLDFVKEGFPEKLERAFIFDVFEGESIGAGKKSVGLATIFRDPDGTITDDEANALHERIVSALVERFSATIRM